MTNICECEDYPCCGHSAEDRYTTYKQAMKEQEIGHKMAVAQIERERE